MHGELSHLEGKAGKKVQQSGGDGNARSLGCCFEEIGGDPIHYHAYDVKREMAWGMALNIELLDRLERD